jgi:RNA polymerase sigma-70 factor (ECF subfamily)
VTDDEIVAAAKRGDPDAWRTLYRAHAGRLLVWLETRSGGDGAISAEDVAADAWLTAAEKVAHFDGDASDFGGWLFGVARRVAANARRRSARRRTDPVASPPGTASEPGADAAVTDWAWLREVLDGLSPRERDVVLCIDVLGLDVADAAEALGMTPVAVRVARHRALRRLRRSATVTLISAAIS